MQAVRRFRLTLEYDGADFCGWQFQPSARSVQGEVLIALARVTGAASHEAVRVVGASRTDAGVHARGQTAHVDAATRLDADALERALNGELPRDVAVREALEVTPEFHAQRDPLSKQYVYRLHESPRPSPLRHGRVWRLWRGGRDGTLLDLDAMGEAASAGLGQHDFAAFRGAHGGPPPDQSTLRSLDRLDVTREGDEVRILASGRSFLRYMVRNLVGTLVEVGLGRRDPAEMAALLASGDRALAGPTAPPQGLCLERVVYPS